jgi:hypothetical protein
LSRHVYYYGGGDALIYHRDCVSVAKLFLKILAGFALHILPLDAECSIRLTAKQGGSFIL